MDAEPGQAYFTKTKMMNDYSINFDEEQYVNDHVRSKNVKGRYNKANFEANRQFSAIDKIKAALASGIPTWDLPCVRDTFTEDNDTEEENEDDDNQEESKESDNRWEYSSTFERDHKP